MELQSSEGRIADAGTTEALWDALREYFRGTVVQRLAYLHLPPLGALDSDMPGLLVEGMPEALASRYLEQRLYRDNPVVARAHRLVEPVYWDDIVHDELTPREQAFIGEFRTAGLRYGVGLPLYGPDGRRGQCGLGFRDGVRRLDPELLSEFWQMCELAHLRYCALVLPTLGPPPKLTRRESEVLGWVARGKSNATIGEILGISSATVDAHLRRIFLKLGVFDRISAAVRGIGSGLIYAEL